MSNEIMQTTPVPEGEMNAENGFKGYSMEDLRYQRALIALQKEFCKSKIIHKADRIRKNGLFGNDGNASKVARLSGIAGKLLYGLSYLDYAMLGMSLFGSGRKIYKFFKGKR